MMLDDTTAKIKRINELREELRQLGFISKDVGDVWEIRDFRGVQLFNDPDRQYFKCKDLPRLV